MQHPKNDPHWRRGLPKGGCEKQAAEAGLGIVAVLLFLIGLLVLFAGRVDGFIGFMILAWLVSPYGLPMAASWLTERVADFNRMLKSI